ncbi:MAG: response regulator transcription factor [Oscillospiraceae bacterium]|nr:response regulator transcription factor [Oscillospiraceae bacterium]
MASHRILIVEDDPDLAVITETRLALAGYASDTVRALSGLPAMLEEQTYHLILMNTVMPDGESEEMCRVIRARCHCPIIFLSAFEDSGVILKMLDAGADDYMLKPIRYDELLLRIETRINQARVHSDRETPNWSGKMIRLKRLVIDLERRNARLNGEDAGLSPIEFSLLAYMAEKQDALLLYEDLYRQVWDADCLEDVRTVMVHISNLRKKIDPERDGLIQTVRGAGYIFCDL